jgi:hypothetical protein
MLFSAKSMVFLPLLADYRCYFQPNLWFFCHFWLIINTLLSQIYDFLPLLADYICSFQPNLWFLFHFWLIIDALFSQIYGFFATFG